MRPLDNVLGLLKTLLLDLLAFILGAFVIVETWARTVLIRAGLPREFINVILIALALVLLAAVVRLFGGLFRLLLLVFLVLLVTHILLGSTAPL